MKKVIGGVVTTIAIAFTMLFGIPAAQANQILTPEYPASVYWDADCDIHATRAADIVNPGNIGNVTVTEEDMVWNSQTGEYEWIQYNTLKDSSTYWVNPLPDGFTFTPGTNNRTVEVHYLVTYCG